MYVNFSSLKRLPLRCAGVRNACWGKMSNSSTKESHLRQSWRYLWVFQWFSPGNVMALWDKTCLDFFYEFSQTLIAVTVSRNNSQSTSVCQCIWIISLSPCVTNPFWRCCWYFHPTETCWTNIKTRRRFNKRHPYVCYIAEPEPWRLNDGKSPWNAAEHNARLFWGVSHETPDRLFFKDRGPAGLVSLVRHSCWGWHEEGFSLKWRNDWEGAELLFPRFLMVFDAPRILRYLGSET